MPLWAKIIGVIFVACLLRQAIAALLKPIPKVNIGKVIVAISFEDGTTIEREVTGYETFDGMYDDWVSATESANYKIKHNWIKSGLFQMPDKSYVPVSSIKNIVVGEPMEFFA